MVWAFVVVFLVMSITTIALTCVYNGLIERARHVDEEAAAVETALARREPVLDELSVTVGAYLGETEALGDLARTRERLAACQDMSERLEVSRELEANVARLLENAKGQPDLSESNGFRTLQEDLAARDEEVRAACTRLDESREAYDKALVTRPWSVVARLLDLSRASQQASPAR